MTCSDAIVHMLATAERALADRRDAIAFPMLRDALDALGRAGVQLSETAELDWALRIRARRAARGAASRLLRALVAAHATDKSVQEAAAAVYAVQ
jgi:hypothetical protein